MAQCLRDYAVTRWHISVTVPSQKRAAKAVKLLWTLIKIAAKISVFAHAVLIVHDVSIDI